ncbi:MAG: EMC3/TMCO1 family protein, partial [Promethearchaeota archaeon]
MINQDTNAFMDWLLFPPGSMIFVILLACATALISSLLTKWLVDTEEIERKQRQIKEHQEEKEKIVKLAETDPDRYRKHRKRWERKDAMLKKTQQSMGMA